MQGMHSMADGSDGRQGGVGPRGRCSESTSLLILRD